MASCSATRLRDCKFNLGDFELSTTLGTGTFGRVILAKEKKNGEFYALKIMSIADIIRLKQVEHVQNEKRILVKVENPFVVNLLWTHHDSKFLYMVFEYVCGGELFTYLRTAGKFNNTTGLFYSAEIVSALAHLHSVNIVYRDLKPENLLLDKEGHVKITDFGFAKEVLDKTWTLCGTPEYLAPEIIQSKGHNKAVDWWALGVLIYEMLIGYPPFFDDNPFGIYEKILAGKVEWPKTLDNSHAKDLIKKLLVHDRTRRLGCLKNGAEDVKAHKWFKGIDWDVVIQRKLKPPIVPRISHAGDTRNFDDYPEEDWQSVTSVSSKQLEPFEDF